MKLNNFYNYANRCSASSSSVNSSVSEHGPWGCKVLICIGFFPLQHTLKEWNTNNMLHTAVPQAQWTAAKEGQIEVNLCECLLLSCFSIYFVVFGREKQVVWLWYFLFFNAMTQIWALRDEEAAGGLVSSVWILPLKYQI